jgi:D-arabinose 5-phosphate isomerase GutQ
LELTGLLAVQAGLVRCFEIMSEEDGDMFAVGTGRSAEILVEFALVLAAGFFCLVWGFAVRAKS